VININEPKKKDNYNEDEDEENQKLIENRKLIQNRIDDHVDDEEIKAEVERKKIKKDINKEKKNENIIKENRCPYCSVYYEIEAGCKFVTCISHYCKGKKYFCHNCKSKLTQSNKIAHFKYGQFDDKCIGTDKNINE